MFSDVGGIYFNERRIRGRLERHQLLRGFVGVIAQHGAYRIRVGTDDRQRADLFRERQHAVIFQQHHALTCNFARQAALVGGFKDFEDLAFVHVWILEQTKLEFLLQVAADGEI